MGVETMDRDWAVRFVRLSAEWCNSLADCIDAGQDVANPGWWEQEQANIERNCFVLSQLAHVKIVGEAANATLEGRSPGRWYAGIGKRLKRLLGRPET